MPKRSRKRKRKSGNDADQTRPAKRRKMLFREANEEELLGAIRQSYVLHKINLVTKTLQWFFPELETPTDVREATRAIWQRLCGFLRSKGEGNESYRSQLYVKARGRRWYVPNDAGLEMMKGLCQQNRENHSEYIAMTEVTNAELLGPIKNSLERHKITLRDVKHSNMWYFPDLEAAQDVEAALIGACIKLRNSCASKELPEYRSDKYIPYGDRRLSVPNEAGWRKLEELCEIDRTNECLEEYRDVRTLDEGDEEELALIRGKFVRHKISKLLPYGQHHEPLVLETNQDIIAAVCYAWRKLTGDGAMPAKKARRYAADMCVVDKDSTHRYVLNARGLKRLARKCKNERRRARRRLNDFKMKTSKVKFPSQRRKKRKKAKKVVTSRQLLAARSNHDSLPLLEFPELQLDGDDDLPALVMSRQGLPVVLASEPDSEETDLMGDGESPGFNAVSRAMENASSQVSATSQNPWQALGFLNTAFSNADTLMRRFSVCVGYRDVLRILQASWSDSFLTQEDHPDRLGIALFNLVIVGWIDEDEHVWLLENSRFVFTIISNDVWNNFTFIKNVIRKMLSMIVRRENRRLERNSILEYLKLQLNRMFFEILSTPDLLVTNMRFLLEISKGYIPTEFTDHVYGLQAVLFRRIVQSGGELLQQTLPVISSGVNTESNVKYLLNSLVEKAPLDEFSSLSVPSWILNLYQAIQKLNDSPQHMVLEKFYTQSLDHYCRKLLEHKNFFLLRKIVETDGLPVTSQVCAIVARHVEELRSRLIPPPPQVSLPPIYYPRNHGSFFAGDNQQRERNSPTKNRSRLDPF